jgi:hypothetical protein
MPTDDGPLKAVFDLFRHQSCIARAYRVTSRVAHNHTVHRGLDYLIDDEYSMTL